MEVIVLNWNGRDDTVECLAAVEPQLREVAGSAITVVDNGSTDGSIAAVTSRFPNARFIPLGTNRGFTGGIAAALSTSHARNVVFLNNDAVPEPGWLAELSSAIDAASEDVVSVGGKIVDKSGARIDFIGGVLTFDGHALQTGFRMDLGDKPEPAPGDEILFACGGNMISRREPFMRLGGFDDDYFAYLEDVDFGWRTWLSGGRILFERQAVVRHASGATSERLGNFERGVLFERNALQTVMKNYETETFAASMAPVLFTYMHRLHHYATSRNLNSSELKRDMHGRPETWHSRKLMSRVMRRIRGPKPLATIDDPLTAMQFRALDWILRHEARIAEKRTAVQQRRQRTDRDIFSRFPLQIVPTYPGDETMMRGPLFELLRPSLPSAVNRLDDIIRK